VVWEKVWIQIVLVQSCKYKSWMAY